MKRGQRIRVTWKNPANDWEWFIYLGQRGYLIHLQGADDPVNGSTHDGDKFWCPMSEIASIVEA